MRKEKPVSKNKINKSDQLKWLTLLRLEEDPSKREVSLGRKDAISCGWGDGDDGGGDSRSVYQCKKVRLELLN